MNPQLFKLLTASSVVIFVYLIYKIYQEDFHVWSCEAERNGPSCSVVGLISEQRGNPMKALKFYQQSCDLDYALGCYHLFTLLEKMNEQGSSQQALEKACELNSKMACEKLKR